MSNENFTKGEWYVGQIYPLPAIYIAGKRIATISKELPISEREANAILMAAAPDLLECLNLVLGSFSLEKTEHFGLKRKCEKAIAKADGFNL